MSIIRNKANPFFARENHVKTTKREKTKKHVFVEPGPAGPEAITDWDVEAGSEPGTIAVTISSFNGAGDGPEVDDGLGEITGVEVRVDGGPWELMEDPE